MFYDRLNDLCKKIGSNITEVSIKHLGVSSATPTGWKRGSYPRADVVIKAAKFFDVSADYLLGLDDKPSKNGGPQFTKDELELIERLRTADPDVYHAAVASVYALLDSLDRRTEKSSSFQSGNEMPESDVV